MTFSSGPARTTDWPGAPRPRPTPASPPRPFAASTGPLLEAGAGSAAATARLHATSTRPTVLVDRSLAMLERAARRIAAASPGHELPARVRLEQADLLALPSPACGFTTVLGLGLTHLFDDPGALVEALQEQVAPGGSLHVTGLVAESRRGRRYLELLHRAGEVTEPLTGDQLHAALGHPAEFRIEGCMAYATVPRR